ncbi:MULTISPECIES: hypothetical protein [Micromonospora]|uniref:hypothetical protein n=1 Tax=Micromonospora TaxID=1873 RepID=UPI000F5E7418|nr:MULTISPECIES: hypothetical protein [Micromonospora]MBQ1067025.1 hypothetical protein [Micromonospora sp. D75]NED50409.1 hypothetical protein [Micromonospora aurantiaca]
MMAGTEKGSGWISTIYRSEVIFSDAKGIEAVPGLAKHRVRLGTVQLGEARDHMAVVAAYGGGARRQSNASGRLLGAV